MSDIFLSYAREDREAVDTLASELTELGWSVWWDDRIAPAAEFDEVIEHELDSAPCVVVVWSRSSIASSWVRAEAGAADEQGKLIPVTFERDVVPPLRFRQLNTTSLGGESLVNPTEVGLRLLAEISRLTGKTPGGVDAQLLTREGASRSSGARRVTPGQWELTTRFLGARGTYKLDLHPNGTVSGTGSWLISRADLAGRWFWDGTEEVLQLELSGGISEGTEALRVEIKRWIDDHTAECVFQRRSGVLRRVSG